MKEKILQMIDERITLHADLMRGSSGKSHQYHAHRLEEAIAIKREVESLEEENQK